MKLKLIIAGSCMTHPPGASVVADGDVGHRRGGRFLHDGLADSKYRPCPLLVKYVEAGWLGRKSGRGFYDYRGEVPVPTR